MMASEIEKYRFETDIKVVYINPTDRCNTVFAFTNQIFTLNNCIEYGLKNNPALKAAEFSVYSAVQNKKAMRADFLPSISSSYSLNSIISEDRIL